MNRVKYVPADRTARALAPSSNLVLTCAQRKEHLAWPLFKFLRQWRKYSVREADKVAMKRGWVRLSDLPPAERRRHILAMRTRQPQGG